MNVTISTLGAIVVVVSGAILGMESLGRIMRDLLDAGVMGAIAGIVIVVIGSWSLHKLLTAIVNLIRRR